MQSEKAATVLPVSGDAGDNSLEGSSGNDTINGLGGNDTLIGGDANDSLDGGSGNDVLYGGNDNDTLIAGHGNDTLYGSYGDDTYRFSSGFGHDVVNGSLQNDNPPSDFSNNDTLQFTDLKSTDAIFTADKTGDPTNLTISFKNSTDQLQVTNNSIQNFQFADTNLTFAQVTSRFQIQGTTGNDNLAGSPSMESIYGYGGNDTLTANASDDTLIGGTGNDTYILNKSRVTIIENANEGSDTAYLNFKQSDMTFLSSRNDFIARYNGTTWLTAKNEISTKGLDYLHFSDGSTVSVASILNALPANQSLTGSNGNDSLTGAAGSDTIIGNAGNDTLHGAAGDDSLNGSSGNDILYGGTSNDTLIGGPGNDTLSGDAGVDTYQFSAGFGHDSILSDPKDAVPSGESTARYDNVLQFTNINSADAIFTTNIAEDSLTISFKNSTDQLQVLGKGVSNTDETYPDKFAENYQFTYQFADTALNPFQAEGRLQVLGTTGDDTFNIVDSGQTFLGGTGDDNYVISSSYFPDNITLVENANEGNDTAYLPYSQFNYAFRSSGNDLIATFLPTDTDQLTIKNELLTHGLESINFGGEQVSVASILDQFPKSITGTSENDTLTASNANDTIHGAAGNDLINGGSGSNILFGDAGEDTLYGQTGNDLLYGGAGNDSLYGGDGNDYMSSYVGNDSLYGQAGNDTLYGGDGNDSLDGGDGYDQLVGDAGNDTVYGQAGNDTLIAGQGNDMLNGGAGNDSYRFSKGDGEDTVSDSLGSNTFTFDNTIQQSTVALFKDANNHLQIGYTNSVGDHIAVNDMNTIGRLQLASGNYLTNADLSQVIQTMASYAAQEGISLNSLNAVEQNQNLMSIIQNAWHK